MVEALLAAYSVVLGGMFFATWLLMFEIRKTFRGGIFWRAWRLIATSVLFFMASELAIAYEAVYGSTFAVDATSQSFNALGSIFLLTGVYMFYRAWNPKAMAKTG
jgi:hypothetical protein